MPYTPILEDAKAAYPFPASCNNVFIAPELDDRVRFGNRRAAKIGDKLSTVHPYIITKNENRAGQCRVRIGNETVALRALPTFNVFFPYLKGDYVLAHDHGPDPIPNSYFEYPSYPSSARVRISPT